MAARCFCIAISLLSLATIVPAPAHAAELTADRQYYDATAYLMMRIREFGWIESTCSEAFPATSATNKRALEKWRSKYQPFIAEVDSQITAIERHWKKAPLAQQPATSALDQFNAYMKEMASLRMGSYRKGASFESDCGYFSQLLEWPHTDFENKYVAEVAAMRNGVPMRTTPASGPVLRRATSIAPPNALRTKTFIARLSKCTPFDYPREALIKEMTGTVAVEVHVLADGAVGAVAVTKSSGFPILDEAAMAGFNTKCTYTPATLDGKNVASWMGIGYAFTLE